MLKRMRLVTLALTLIALAAPAQKAVWNEQEKAIAGRMKLRRLPDDERARATRQLALDIRQLPSSSNKVSLASQLANLATEGDFGRDTLQEVAATLAETLRAHPLPESGGQPASPYVQLAQLIRYENMRAALDTPQLTAAMAKLEADDEARGKADFTLEDLDGNAWTLSQLRGKVVLVNFWATWCPPCRKEMPDLDALHERFKAQGFVILAISDEPAEKVRPFISGHKYKFPVLLDSGRAVNQLFRVEGIPKTFIFDRAGKLAAQSIDMRTIGQFLALLEKAGLR
jgi:peroxiredoxin